MNTDAAPVDQEGAVDPGTRSTAAADDELRNKGASSQPAGMSRLSDKWIEDVALMQRFQEQGDYGAFEVLFLRHKRGLLSFITRLSGDRIVAEDVSQQTWLRLIEAARQRSYAPRNGASFQTWLFTMARNRFVDDYVRRHDVARVSRESDTDLELRDVADAEDKSPESHVSTAQLRKLIHDAVAELPFEQREVIAMWSSGMDVEGMMQVTGAPRDTVLSRKKYAIAKLRLGLARLGVNAG
jgi:RNA polymerase sigma-70 factor (ECF subfamily)